MIGRKVDRLLSALQRSPEGATYDALVSLGGHDPETLAYAVANGLIEIRPETVPGVYSTVRIYRKNVRIRKRRT